MSLGHDTVSRHSTRQAPRKEPVDSVALPLNDLRIDWSVRVSPQNQQIMGAPKDAPGNLALPVPSGRPDNETNVHAIESSLNHLRRMELPI